MIDLSHAENHVHCVTNFQELADTSFNNNINAICWERKLVGDFSEIVKKIESEGNITVIDPQDLHELELTKQGQLAREILLNDMKLLEYKGAAPVLNLIKHYDRDDSCPFFPTDVYSYHVDRSPVPTDTILCTYFGAPSDILANSQADQKIQLPEIRKELQKLHSESDQSFESFLTEYFFDLHYQAKPYAQPTNLGIGNLWRLAIDHPESNVLPCIHRAPKEKREESRLLLIC